VASLAEAAAVQGAQGVQQQLLQLQLQQQLQM
jgi:hypothetical protein